MQTPRPTWHKVKDRGQISRHTLGSVLAVRPGEQIQKAGQWQKG